MKKKILFAVLTVSLLLTVGLVGYDSFILQTDSVDFFAMNTTVSVKLNGIKRQEMLRRIQQRVTDLDQKRLSRTSDESEIAKINRSQGGTVEAQTAEWLKTLKELEQKSNFAFTADLGALTELWGIGTENERIPSREEISAVLLHTKKWSIQGNAVSLEEGAVLDLGAVGKGIACDEIRRELEQTRTPKAIAAVGGSILLYSTNENETFRIGIRDPQGEVSDYAVVLTTGNGCVSTSGNYERCFVAEDGTKYHHIFNPATGYPAQSGLQSVTVLCPSGLLSDALSTACFVLGYEKSLVLLEAYGAKAVFITEDNRILTYGDFADSLEITAERYTLAEEPT
ncbi:MAG TPA: FAD:protein FMN transferase [Ruminococcaceae bacterium]|nr:FAD:protein FMN transferase [Oscillospiraceae bacterium]